MQIIKRLPDDTIFVSDACAQDASAVVREKDVNIKKIYQLVISVRRITRDKILVVLLNKQTGAPMFQGAINELGSCSFDIPDSKWADGILVQIKTGTKNK